MTRTPVSNSGFVKKRLQWLIGNNQPCINYCGLLAG